MELNPKHPVTRQMHDHWHKIVGVLMKKYGLTDFQITQEDVDGLGDQEIGVIFDTRGGEVWVRLRSLEEAKRMERENRGDLVQ